MIRRFARPYAKALMELVTDSQRALDIQAELMRFEAARADSPELAGLLANPGVEAAHKTAVLREIASRMNLSDLSLRIIEVLIANNRANDLRSVLEAWTDMLNHSLGISVAEVRTAHELSEDEVGRLRETLEKKLNRRIDLRVTTDRSLLGGFVAKVGTDVYDTSVSSQVRRLRESIS